jgi:hypothetical protein
VYVQIKDGVAVVGVVVVRRSVEEEGGLTTIEL